MKTLDRSGYAFQLVALVAAAVGGASLGRLAGLPLPAAVAGLLAALLALRVAAMFVRVDEPAAPTAGLAEGGATAPALRAANG